MNLRKHKNAGFSKTTTVHATIMKKKEIFKNLEKQFRNN
jgi:hypothetical protein